MYSMTLVHLSLKIHSNCYQMTQTEIPNNVMMLNPTMVQTLIITRGGIFIHFITATNQDVGKGNVLHLSVILSRGMIGFPASITGHLTGGLHLGGRPEGSIQGVRPSRCSASRGVGRPP